ncbi:MAG: alpha/beta hydrolase-fold protein [Colwellia sp.]|nr:alpha/beta hydrolase-fold protein [Colwellia sp.]
MIVLILCLCTVVISWLATFYLLGAFIDIAPYTVGNVYYIAEIVLAFAIYFLGSYFAIKYTKCHPFFAALPVGITGLIFYYIELGGLNCLGVCGMPLWYDLVSFFKHVSASILACVLATGKRHSNITTIMNINVDENSNWLSKLPSIKWFVGTFSVIAVIFLLWVNHLYSNVVANSETVSLYSQILKEQRKVTVFLPSGYLNSDQSFDVLYTLDGENPQHNFLAAITAKVLTDLGIIPKIIVVAINGQGMRARDFLLKGAVDVNGRDASGEAHRFHQFLDSELIPTIARGFRTSDRKIIAGHSYGGLFTAYSFTEHRDIFDGYFSFSPSFQDSNTSVTSFRQGLNQQFEGHKFIYLNLGLEGGIMRESFKQVESIIENQRVEKLRTAVNYYSLPHALIMIPGYFKALIEFYQQ